jgi:hypothetical protein
VTQSGRFGARLPFDTSTILSAGKLRVDPSTSLRVDPSTSLRVDGSKVARFDKLDCKKRKKNGEKLVFFCKNL